MRGVEPELVLLQGPAHARAVVVDLLELRHRRTSAGLQGVAQVVGLQIAVRVVEIARPREGVAAGLGHHVQLHAAGIGLRRHTATLELDFLHIQLIDEKLLVGATTRALHVIERHAVVEHAPVRRVAPVDREEPVGVGLVPADIVLAKNCTAVKSNGQGRKAVHRFIGRQCVQHLALQHILGPDVLHVDEGAGARHRHGLFDGADRQLRIHGRRESGGQLDSFPGDGPEPRDGECEPVGPRGERLYQVAPLRVRRDRARAFDQRGARGLNGDAR